MIGLPANTRIWIAAGVTDMRAGFNSLAVKVQTVLERNPYGGHVSLQPDIGLALGRKAVTGRTEPTASGKSRPGRDSQRGGPNH